MTSRLFIISMLIFIQLSVLVLVLIYLSWIYIPVYFAFTALGFIISIIIINRNDSPTFKIAWIVPVLAFPIGGSLFYILFGRSHLNKKNTRRLENAINSARPFMHKDDEAIQRLNLLNAHAKREATYIIDKSRSNLYFNTQTEFLSPGERFFESLMTELKKAEKFIFLEYFIIGEGRMWNEILDVLCEKIKNGVEVRLMYDDIGCISTLKLDFPDRMRKLGLAVAVFNPYRPSMDKFLNYRDHRKFAIIDGKVAFTGGINIADEYINEKVRFGFWSDAAVSLKGDAVNKITVLFLEMWYFMTNVLPDYQKYLVDYKCENDGVVIPFSDEPLVPDLVCETAYLNVINDARSYVYICTPYLILDEVMLAALTRAAQSGIDVKIITPHIPDKKLIFMLTRANYVSLIEGGVEIYEYTPGFMHTKEIISDDETAIVGTSNFDFRSFYLHFENGMWMYQSKAVMQAKESFLLSLRDSQRVTMEDCRSVKLPTRIIRSLLKALSPLL